MSERGPRDGISRRAFLGGAAAGVAAVAAAAPAAGARRNEMSLGFDPIPLEKPVALEDLPTPALVVDQDALERNLARMAGHVKAKRVGLRPHTKTHKCPVLAKKQLALGAMGICVAKVSEAEVMVEAGVGNVLITSPLSTRDKLARVVALAKRAPGLQVVVDHPQSLALYDEAARAAKVKLRVLIDLDTGTIRTGIAPGKPALALAEQIAKSPALQLDGCQAYAGHVMHVNGHADRKQKSQAALAPCVETWQLLKQHGFEAPVFSGGGTGTYDIDDGTLTDLQLGSYLFMDVQYQMIGDAGGPVFDDFEPSLFVLATAISQPVGGAITIDAGFKAFAHEPDAKPRFRRLEGLVYHYGGDEHGIVQYLSDARPLVLGQKAELIVSHCDPTVNLYDVIHPYRNGRVSELWPISARGKSQ
jgi:D-serine deaminase-like pyridoxal phosphate-dependent protein